MNFVTVGTRPVCGTLDPSIAPEVFTAIGAGLIADSGLIIPAGSKMPKRMEDFLKHVEVHIGMEGIESRFLKPISLHLSSEDPSLQSEIIDIIKPRKITSIDTSARWIEKKQGHLEKLKEDVDLLFLNQEEARLLTGKRDPQEAARALSDGRIAVVKLGKEGCIVADDDVWRFPAYPVKVADDAYAGDAFAGAFTAYLSKRPSITKAAMYAMVVASFCIEGGIERLAQLQRKDVRSRYKAYLKMF